ncbi:MAG: hypothetical protein Q8L04_03630 [Ignavibacteria bacterium]|nr:hypothetical protein [Ignavibacteria bacterium]
MELKPNYVINEDGQKIYAVVPIEEYNRFIIESKKNRRKIEELEEQLDIKFAQKSVKKAGDVLNFSKQNYV